VVSTAAEHATPAAAARGRSRLFPWLPVAVLVLIFLFALLFYGEARYRNCIARAEAEFPAVAVSSFNQRDTGPLKVSYVGERARALERCGRF
jgi:hypothetical protein